MTKIFVTRGAGMNSDVLAANAILFQLQYLMASLFDGLANAASVFAGRSVGSRNRAAFFESIEHGGIGFEAQFVGSLGYL